MKSPLIRRYYIGLAVACLLLILNPLNREWFEGQGCDVITAIFLSTLILGTFFAFSMCISGCYRESKN